MGEITVHGDQQFVSPVVGPLNAGLVCAANAQLLRPVNGKSAGVGFHKMIDDAAGSIDGVVIHEQDVRAQVEGPNLVVNSCYVLDLVIGRNENQRLLIEFHGGPFLLRQEAVSVG